MCSRLGNYRTDPWILHFLEVPPGFAAGARLLGRNSLSGCAPGRYIRAQVTNTASPRRKRAKSPESGGIENGRALSARRDELDLLGSAKRPPLSLLETKQSILIFAGAFFLLVNSPNAQKFSNRRHERFGKTLFGSAGCDIVGGQ